MNSTIDAPASIAAATNFDVNSLAGEYLTFCLGAEEYGISILNVQEIRSYVEPTRIPNTSAFFKGVINLRGIIVPIVDLRLKMACTRAEFNASTVVVVLNVGAAVVGVIVDSVSDTMGLEADAIHSAPSLADAPGSGHITGLGCVKTEEGERTLVLLDVGALLSSMGLSGADV
jgi:purine-binding chemotaxis protein CheW